MSDQFDDTSNQIPSFFEPAASVTENPSAVKSFWLDALETVAIAFGIFFIIYTFIAQPHLVKGESMLPNYHDGEYILTSKVYSWWGNPSRGDVIVFKSPQDKSVQFIKRVIGLPGEKVEVSNNHVIIFNAQHPKGMTLKESYLGSQTTTEGNSFLQDGQIYAIPQNQYIVFGDNRNFSYDSRSWGTIQKQDIIGKAFFIYWPIPDFGLVTHAKYN